MPNAGGDDIAIRPVHNTTSDWVNYNYESWFGYYIGLELF